MNSDLIALLGGMFSSALFLWACDKHFKSDEYEAYRKARLELKEVQDELKRRGLR